MSTNTTSARRWDAEGAGAKVSAALADVEESRRARNETTKVKGYAVTAFDCGTVCVAVVMEDDSIERVMFRAETALLQ